MAPSSSSNGGDEEDIGRCQSDGALLPLLSISLPAAGAPHPTYRGEKHQKGGQERGVVEGQESPERGPPQETDNWSLELVPDARGQEGCWRWSIMS